MLELILGRAGTGKTGRIMDAVAGRVARQESGAVLIVPEQYSHEAERELCRRCGDTACLYAEVLSFTRLAARAEASAGRPQGQLLSAGGRLLCMTLALDAVGERLRVYGQARRRAELQSRLLDAVDTLKAACISPEVLERAAERCYPALGDKLRDLALILAGYDAVAANGYLDPGDRLTRLGEALEQGDFAPAGPVYVDGFTDFTRQEFRILSGLLAQGVEMTVCLTCDRETDSELFYVTRSAVAALRRMAGEKRVPVKETWAEAPGRRRAPALEFLDQRLFTYTRETCRDAEEAVTLIQARSLAQECELCAARVRELVRTTGCRWRDVAVAVRGFEDYRDQLESAFAFYGVPLYAARRSAVSGKNPAALIHLAYALLEGGWDQEEMTAYLRTGLLGLSQEETDALENYSFTWRLRGRDWTKDLDWERHPDGLGREWTPEDEHRLAELNRLRRAVSAPLLALERRSRRAGTALEQVRALAAFLEELELPRRLAERAALLESRGQGVLAAEYAQIWDVLTDCLEQCAAILGTLPLDREAFARLWRVTLSQYDLGTIPVALDQVSAGDMDRMRRRELRHLIVLGCTDARLPRVEADGGLFTDAERQALLELDLPLGGGAENLYRELNLIYQCFTLPSDTLTLLCSPDGDGDGAGFVMGSIARMLEMPVRPGDVDAARLTAPGPALLLAARDAAEAGDARCAAAADWHRRHGGGEKLAALARAARMGRGRLSPEAVRRLYGPHLTLTASRADKLAGCKFAFFLQYGLKARPRKPADFAPPELGSFLHFVLERVARAAGARGGFAAITEAELSAVTDESVAEYVRTELNDFRERSARFVYLFRRLSATVRQVVGDMARELRRSDFQPLDLELDFSAAGDLPPVELGAGDGAVRLTGVADRVDGWLHAGKLYLRVVDYKTGKKAFSLSDVCQGLGMQMLIYLFALERSGRARYGREIVPAGVLYVPARDVTVSADGDLPDDELERARRKALRRSGLLLGEKAVLAAMERSGEPEYIPVTYKNGDPQGRALATAEQLGQLSRHVERTLCRMAGELRGGAIQADPYYRSAQETACLTCDYFEACHFEEGQDQRRYLTKYTVDAAWAVIRGEEGDGHGEI